jgi:hypothetical protein
MRAWVVALLVTVTPAIVVQGATVIVTCRVPQAAAHREILWGIVGFASSARSMDGANAPTTYRQEFRRVPCDVEAAFCAVRSADRRWQRVVAPMRGTCVGDSPHG